MPKSVILDVDTGIDDALAIILALKSEELDVRGITTVAGNTDVEQATENTLRILQLIGRLDIPVYKEATKPFKGRGQRGKTSGSDGLCDLSKSLPEPQKKAEGKMAAQFLTNPLLNSPSKISIIAMAPLTNIAFVLIKEPKIKKKIKGIYIMGGAVEVGGNVTPYAEFNFYNDPEAVKVVFESQVPVTLVPLDVTTKLLITHEWVLKNCTDESSPAAQFLKQAVIKRYQMLGKDWMYLNDPLAVGAAISSDFIKTQKDKINIISNGKCKGQLVKTSKGQPVVWTKDVDVEKFVSLFRENLFRCS